MVRVGLDILLTEQIGLLRGRRAGLVTHAAAVLPDLTGAADALLGSGVRLAALFGPEHGVAGAAAEGAEIGHAVDRRTGLRVWSLYGPAKEPTDAMLAGIDLLLFDMQDVGARFYTYISTLLHVLRTAARAGIPIVVLDRPNPIGGAAIEGPLVEPGHESFVGAAPLPIRHGLTIGEVALWMNATCALGTDLTVIPLRGWRRDQWFDQTGLPWVPTSPAMPHLSTATLYPGMCLFEGTNLSVGRGTSLPFEICGAPWIDGDDLAARLNALELPGVRFRALAFTPSASRCAGQLCGGVQVHVADRAALRPVALGLHMIAAARALAPREFAWEAAHFDRLAGSPSIRQALEGGVAVERITEGWQAIQTAFERRRQAFLRY